MPWLAAAIGLIGSYLASWLGTLLMTLLFLFVPVLLFNIEVDWVSRVLTWLVGQINTFFPAGSVAIQWTGLIGWFWVRLRLTEIVLLYAAAWGLVFIWRLVARR